MTHQEFSHIQDTILSLTGRELAEKLGVSPSAIVLWRKAPEEGGREIPDYIQRLLHYLEQEKLGTLTLPLTIAEISGLCHLASQRGLSFEALLADLIRRAIHQGKVTPLPEPLSRVADDETPYGKPAKAGLKGKQAG